MLRGKPCYSFMWAAYLQLLLEYNLKLLKAFLWLPLLPAKLPLISKVLHSQNEKLTVGKFNPSRQRFGTGFFQLTDKSSAFGLQRQSGSAEINPLEDPRAFWPHRQVPFLRWDGREVEGLGNKTCASSKKRQIYPVTAYVFSHRRQKFTDPTFRC